MGALRGDPAPTGQPESRLHINSISNEVPARYWGVTENNRRAETDVLEGN